MSTTRQTQSEWEPKRLASLTAWYGKRGNLDPSIPGQESRILEVDPDSTNGRILGVLQGLFDNEADPAQTADSLASLVLADNDPDNAWTWMSGDMCIAAQLLPIAELEKLADTLVHLAKLPYALPTASYPTSSSSGRAELAYLPNFGFTLSEHMQGPRQYVCRMELVTREAQIAAAGRWRNISTFAAILTRRYYQQALPKPADMRVKAWWTLANALEYDVLDAEVECRDTEYVHIRDKPLLWLPAALQWVSIMRRYILEAAFEEPQRARTLPGPLWVATGGNDTVGTERWYFWQQRLRYLAEVQTSDSETREALAGAAHDMDISIQQADCSG